MNKNMNAARNQKNDEFYTQITDIEKELSYYKKYLKGKVVLCNCDDPLISNFVHYFINNFERLGLKKLIATCYKNDQIDMFSNNDTEEGAAYYEYIGTKNKNGIPDKEEIRKGVKSLKGSGDFRSKECIELLNQADIVVTNPPFSLFREYVAQLMLYKKKFIIIGNAASIIYKEIFPLIRDNKMWYGMSSRGMNFKNTEGKLVNVNACWFTNLPHKRLNEKLVATQKYKGNENNYPKYDNYDVIEVSKVSDIPKDYSGIMGVPITFLDKYNPDQFEIIGLIASAGYSAETTVIPFLGKGDARVIINGEVKYSRLLIRWR